MSKIQTVWVYADAAERYADLIAGVRRFGAVVNAVVPCESCAAELRACGPAAVYNLGLAEGEAIENYAETIASLAQGEGNLFLFDATRRSKALAAGVAAKRGAGLVNDALSLEAGDAVKATFRTYGGLAAAAVRIVSADAVVTVGAGVCTRCRQLSSAQHCLSCCPTASVRAVSTMSEEKFDAIVVGAGVAGCVAAYVLAKEGLDVLVIERGNYAGSKNMTGGRLYAHSLERVMPGFAEEAPVERLVTREKISFITDDDSVTLDYHTGEAFSAEAASYTVLRGKFDQWLQEKAESEGAQFIPGIRVDRLLQDETGRVTGVQAGEDELLAECVILADGVNSLLAQSIGLLPKYHAHQYAVGAKEVIGLSKQVINDRFGLSDGEGAAWLFAGSASAGLMGGGFLYTNEDSISLGVVCGLGDIEKSPKTVPQMLEDLKNHPSVKPLIEGGELLEYSGHLVPEGGYDMVPEKLAADGVLITGDAAALCINLGFIVRGMDLAVASGECAARAVIDAKKAGDFSAAGLAGYRRRLEESFVLRDMKQYRNVPHLMENPRLFSDYPKMTAGIMRDLFRYDGSPVPPVRKSLWQRVKAAGVMNLLKDGYGWGKAL